jgi:hypothetical protein
VSRSSVRRESKKYIAVWNRAEVMTNRNEQNVILSDETRDKVFGGVEAFFNNEEEYARLGQPFQKGFMLCGPPGTGKTSIVKALASKHDLEIFTVDLSAIPDEEVLSSLFENIQYVKQKRMHIVLFEDIDKARYHKMRRVLLEVIDGVEECYARLIIMTANNKDEVARDNPGLFRHGRIGECIGVGKCDTKQIHDIIMLFRGEDIDVPDQCSKKVTPATLVGALMSNEYKSESPLALVCALCGIQLPSGEVNECASVCATNEFSTSEKTLCTRRRTLRPSSPKWARLVNQREILELEYHNAEIKLRTAELYAQNQEIIRQYSMSSTHTQTGD